MVKFRWEVASGGKPHPFADDSIEALFSHSAGMPRETNILADNALLLAFYRRCPQITAEIVNQVVESRTATFSRKEAA